MVPLRHRIRTLVLAMALLGQSVAPVLAQDYSFSPVSGQITSPFGWRTDPMTGSPRFHGGIDIGASMGSPVYAPQAGYVMFSAPYKGYGNVVVLNHGNSLYTLYAHNSELLVSPGATVFRGQVIAKVGSTGRSTGPHLHFEVHYNQQYYNPLTYLLSLGPVHSRQNLAQASTGQAYSYLMSAPQQASVTTARTSSSTRQVNRRLRSHVQYGRNAVQMVNGTDVETIQF